MKEIEFFAHNQKTELPEKSAFHRFSDEVYTFAKNGNSFLFATGKPKSIELAAGPNEKILAEGAAEKNTEWKHLLNGNYTRWELLEGTIELAGAIALVRFGVKKIPKWFPSTPKPIVWPEVPTIMSSPIPGSIAKNHPIMRTIIRTNQVIEQTRPMV